MCVCVCVRVHACTCAWVQSGGEREVWEGVGRARKGWKWSGRGGGSGVSVDHPLSSHSLYSTTHFHPWRRRPSSQCWGETASHSLTGQAVHPSTRICPLQARGGQARGLDDHLTPGYHLGLLSRGHLEGPAGPSLPHQGQSQCST